MATKRSGSVLVEAADVRSRLILGRWDASSIDVMSRLRTLGELLKKDHDDELHRHIVVSAIAALQTSHRSTIIQIVDSGEDYRTRAAESFQERFSLQEALGWLSGKSSTFGELVAHFAPCNSATDLLSWLTKILGFDLRSALEVAVDPYERSNPSAAEKLVRDIDVLLADLSEAFKFRHIFAHEAAPSIKLDNSTCSRLLAAVRLWIIAVDAVLWSSIFKELPLTTLEMRQSASRDLRGARDALAQSMRAALRIERKSGRSAWLIKNHMLWRQVVADWSANTYAHMDGTMWPAIATSNVADAVKARAAHIAEWVRVNSPEQE